MSVKTILAAGGVLHRKGRSEIALVVRPSYPGEWSLPKGKLENGESFERAAVREIEEETACIARIVDLVGAIDYRVNKGPKVVLFYDMELVDEGAFRPNSEISEVVWMKPEEALARLSHDQEQEILRRWLA